MASCPTSLHGALAEIGIRMALGATQSGVVTLVLRGALWQILIGLLLGIPAALYADYLMKSLLYGVGSYDMTAIARRTLHARPVRDRRAAFVPRARRFH